MFSGKHFPSSGQNVCLKYTVQSNIFTLKYIYTKHCPNEGKCFPENARHIFKFFSTMKVFVILW